MSRTPTESDWVSAHLFCHGDLDALLSDCVRPTMLALTESGAVNGFFFLRYWDGGPHIRLRMAVPGPEQERLVRAAVNRRCGRYLRAHRSPEAIDEARYARDAQRLAELEEVRDYHRVPFADGSVVFVPYRREYARYGDESALEAVEAHFMRASVIALAMVSSASPEQRRTAAFSMLLLAAVADPQAAPGQVAWPAPAGASVAWIEHYARQRERLRALADRCRGIVAAEGAGPGALNAWYRDIRTLADRLRDRGAGPRTLGHCTHLMCNRLGVPISEEGALRHLVGRTLADGEPMVRSGT